MTPREIKPSPIARRPRDLEHNREVILEAARAAFAARGYARATIREIAQRAAVTPGLVTRHFPSKEELFIAAVPGAEDLAVLVEGELATLPDRVASAYVARMDARGETDPFVALIRSAASDADVAKRLLRAMREESLQSYARVLDVPDIAERVELLGAYLIGVTFSRYVLRAGPLADLPSDRLVAYLSQDLRAILFRNE